ncbi:MAG: TlpA family protein disulfide reductase [Salinibacter sp.]|uniref:TlpA family protein disulfide reductase n=1 Tax=Salinibacter sp. TaxID=2065818 RepID=UPI0035D52AFB
MKTFPRLLLGSLLFVAAAPLAQAQDSTQCKAGQLQLAQTDTSSSTASAASSSATAWAKRSRVTDSTPAASVTPTTKAEAFVQDRIRKKGVHVVHFWAPWCPNSKNELANGWAELVANHPNVTFTFVTVWNNNEKGASTLDKYDIPDRVVEVTQPDLGPSDEESNRRHSFLSLPVTWIPSTWIFHNRGELAFALNYGEMKMDTIQSLLDATRKDW